VATLTLIGKPDCHLCEVARGVIEHVVADLPDDVADRIEIDDLSILDEPELHELWWEKIPVVLVDGRLHAHWRVAPERLRDALLAADVAEVAR
jgi:hypothetical protein